MQQDNACYTPHNFPWFSKETEETGNFGWFPQKNRKEYVR